MLFQRLNEEEDQIATGTFEVTVVATGVVAWVVVVQPQPDIVIEYWFMPTNPTLVTNAAGQQQLTFQRMAASQAPSAQQASSFSGLSGWFRTTFSAVIGAFQPASVDVHTVHRLA